MQKQHRTLAAVALCAALAALPAWGQLKDHRPSRINLFSPQQDVELGREAAAEVLSTMPVVDNATLTNYVSRIGQRLAQSEKAGGYPYEFRVINDPAINAFALPGGPIFVNTGLIEAVSDEAELAGVLAHEISHVALRHGTHQVTKAQGIQLGFMLGASMLGRQGSIWNTLAQLGAGLGAQSLLLKYSRDAERDADLHGAQIMHEIGYNPVRMASFFETLEAESGSSDGGFVQNFMASHPSPGNRVEYVREQNQYLSSKGYVGSDQAELRRVKSIIDGLPEPAASNAGGQGSVQGVDLSTLRPSDTLRRHRNRDFVLYHPDNWEPYGDPNSDSVTVAPQAAVLTNQNGGTDIAYGMIASYYYPEDERVNLQRDTQALVQGAMQANPGLRQNGEPRQVRVAGRNGYLIPLVSNSPFAGERERVAILTVERPEGLFYMVFIAPESEWQAVQGTFDQVVRSIRFNN